MDNSLIGNRESRLSRHACEQCRRKKTRCPAERPRCSFCQRLDQTCTYLPRNGSSEGRKRRTAAKLKSREGSEDQIRLRREFQQTKRQHFTDRLSQGLISHTLDAGNGKISAWSPHTPEPSPEALDRFVQVYKTRIYFQPLPLFSLHGLRDCINRWPQFLRWSFCALCLHYSADDQYHGRETLAIDFYKAFAQDMVNKLIMQGTAKIEVLQTCCLLALCDLFVKSPRAWINVGNATRLETYRRLVLQEPSDSEYKDSESAMCYWSVCVLETTFSPQFTVLTQTPNPPGFPREALVPSPIQVTGRRSFALDLMNVEDTDNADRGINAQCLHAISVWGQIISYLHGIRSGKLEKPWLSTSTFNKLAVELYELESRLSRNHFFRNVSILDRSAAELNEHREYWTPWILMQITSHAARGLLNHPFIHLVALRDKKASQPHLFSQQTVDQALYHSGWVVRLVETCEKLGLEFYDPLIGNMVAAIATIPWFFQFVRDRKVSRTAVESWKKCEGCLERFSRFWPHIGDKLSMLQALQTGANLQQQPDSDIHGITFHAALMWRLIDSNLAQIAVEKAGSSAPDEVGSTTVRVTTHFIHPVSEDAEETPAGMNNFTRGSDDTLEYLSLDDFFFNSMTADLPWLHADLEINSFDAT